MAGNTVRLIGNDGYIAYRSAVGTAVIGDGSTVTLAANTWALITAKASSGSTFGDLEVDEYYISPVEVTPAVGDSWRVVTFARLEDLKGWQLNKTKAEIDVTLLKDDTKKYRAGKADADGSADFIFTQGITNVAGGLANYFYDIVTIDAAGVPTVSSQIDEPLFVIGYLNDGRALDDSTSGLPTRICSIFQVVFLSMPLNMADDSAVEMSVNFRLSGDINPKLYTIAGV